MSDFTLHTKESAPEAAKPLLDNSQAAFGMIPNQYSIRVNNICIKIQQKKHNRLLDISTRRLHKC